MKYHTLFLLKIGKDVAKFVVCCSCDWRFKGSVAQVILFLCSLRDKTRLNIADFNTRNNPLTKKLSSNKAIGIITSPNIF